MFYIQYYCYQENEELNDKRHQALLIGCIGLFSCFIFTFMIYYLMKMQRLQYKEWDVRTVTAGDFTVEYQIPSSVF